MRGHPFHSPGVTLTPTSSGGFSGTFSGNTCEACGFTVQKTYRVQNGTFTNVRF